MLILSVIFGVVFFGQSSSQAEASWRTRQRQQTDNALTPLDDASALGFCKRTNIANIRQLLQPLMVPRVVGTDQHKKVGMYFKRTLDELHFTTEWDRFTDQTPYGPRTFRNLIATFDPAAPRRLVLACHYDSKIMSGFEFIGATDSALPCALLLDIAATLGPLLYKRTNRDVALQLLFLDGEEAFVQWTNKDSIYGARHLANLWQTQWYPSNDGSSFNLYKELDRIDVFVLLDLLGAPRPTIGNHNGLGAENIFRELPRIEGTLRRLNCLENIPAIFSPAIQYAGVEDDHIPFLQKGVRILHLIATPFPRVWHTQYDDNSALDDRTISNLASIIRVFVAEYLGVPSS